MSNGSKTADAAAKNLLKCRDDAQPVEFVGHPSKSEGGRPQFVLAQGATCSWAKANVPFGTDVLRSRVEPWLTALCQSEYLSLLLGSGVVAAVHGLAADEQPRGMGKVDFGKLTTVIDHEADRAAKVAGRGEGNIEDQLRAATELLRGMEILGSTDEDQKTNASDLQAKLAEILSTFAKDMLKCENGLAAASDSKREEAFNYLISFLMSFASRTGTRDRLHIFTTNYDRFIEAGPTLLACICSIGLSGLFCHSFVLPD